MTLERDNRAGDFAIIGSAGGATFVAAMQILETAGFDFSPVIITDRPCGLQEFAKSKNYPVFEIGFGKRQQFSDDVSELLKKAGVNDVLMLFSRLVCEPLISEFDCQNIHPSLLPNYRGLRPVEQAMEDNSDSLGCSLHHVDKGVDTGRVIAQVWCPLHSKVTLSQANRLSYLQKVYLTLLWIENALGLSKNNAPFSELPYSAGVVDCTSDIGSLALSVPYINWASNLEPVA